MIRKAVLKDAVQIQATITEFATKGVMLHRSLNSVYENIRDFWVVVDEEDKVLGCAGLHVVGWEGLAEIKSLSVNAAAQKFGYGKLLVQKCLDEATTIGITKVFALTFVSGFFEKNGFQIIDKETLPHKIWSDCIDCPMFNNCKEIAVVIEL